MRIRILSCLLLVSVASFGQFSTPAVIAPHYNHNRINTNSAGEQVFVAIGNSIQVTSDGIAPTPTTGVLKEWNGSTFVAVTTDVTGANTGTSFPQFANDYFTEFGLKTLLVNKCNPGSEYYPNGNTSNWSPSPAGILYDDAITEIDQALAAAGVEIPAGIFFDLGINDALGAMSLTSIKASMDVLFANLSAKYPNVPILIMQIGSGSNINPVDSRISDLRRHTVEIEKIYANVHFVAPLTSFRGAGQYMADFLHVGQTAQNNIAQMRVRWFKYKRDYPSYEKRAISIAASHFDALSPTRIGLINTFVQTATYQNADMFLNLHTTMEENVNLDWCFMAQPLDFGYDFVANDAITTNPTGTKAFVTGYIPSFMFINISQNDISYGVKVKSNSTAAGVAASAMASTATAQSILEQTTTPSILTRVNDGTLTQYVTSTSFQSDSFYQGYRSGTSKQLWINGTSVQSVTVASTGFTSDAFGIGCRHSAGSVTNLINASFEYAIVWKTTGVASATAYSDLEALRDGW